MAAQTAWKIGDLESRYSELIEELKKYLHPILDNHTNVLKTEMVRVGSNYQKAAKDSSLQTKDSMILLVDEILTITPLELVPLFKTAISRDFSLQMLHHRFKGVFYCVGLCIC